MNIILEGCDKSGKSTLIRDIVTSMLPEIPVVFKLSQKPKDDSPMEREKVIAAYKEMFHQAENNPNHVFIFDRAYPTEMVYSIKRGYDALSEPELLKLDTKLADGNTLLIYCEADPDVIAKRFLTDNEEFAKIEDIERLLERYNIFLTKTKLPYIRINSLTDRFQNLAAVRKFLKQ